MYNIIQPVQEVYYHNYMDLIKKYLSINSSYNFALKKAYVFRGEGNEHYQLFPSAFRSESRDFLSRLMEVSYFYHKSVNEIDTSVGNQILSEWSAFRYFYQNANMQGLPMPQLNDEWMLKFQKDEPIEVSSLDEWIPTELAEVFALMQHYGFPTRMLDWSYGFHIALYFAAMSAANRLKKKKTIENENMVIWIMNLGLVNDILVDDYGEHKIKFITPLYSNNPNLNAQKGVLSYIPINHNQIMHNDDPLKKMSFDKYIENNSKDKKLYDTPLLEKALIPIKDCYSVLHYLDAINVNRLSVFPGYGSIYQNCLDNLNFIGDG